MTDNGGVDDHAADDVAGTHPWSEFVAEATSRLRSAGFVSPEMDARRIVERASGLEGADYHLGLSQLATVGGVSHFDAMMQRRLAGEPLQYVVGSWGFRELDVLVDQRVLIPRPETEMVAGLAIDELKRAHGDTLAVDLGTGSGVIGMSIAFEVVTSRVILTDASADALAVARANLAGLGRAATRVEIHQGEWFEALPADLAGTIQVIISNPPYVTDTETLPTEVKDWEPEMALRAGSDGLRDLKHLVTEAPRWLSSGGVLVLEMAPQQTSVVAQLAEATGFSEVVVHPDLVGRDRAVVARWL